MKNKKIILPVLLISIFLLLYFFYDWWVLSSLQDFQLYYPNLGLIVWFFKNIIIIIFLLSIAYLLYHLIINFKKIKEKAFFKHANNYYLLIAYIVISNIIINQHPFCTFSMYSSFPNSAYMFSLENENNEIIPFLSISEANSSDVADIYYNYLKENNIVYGFDREDSVSRYNAGKKMIHFIENVKNPKFSSLNHIKIVRYYYKVENKKIVQLKRILYEKHY